ncbi:MAG: hypothetical protein QM667_13410 [Asticcacaulis sp.]
MEKPHAPSVKRHTVKDTDDAEVIIDRDSQKRSDMSVNSKGQDERGRYGKAKGNPHAPDSYASKRSNS